MIYAFSLHDSYNVPKPMRLDEFTWFGLHELLGPEKNTRETVKN